MKGFVSKPGEVVEGDMDTRRFSMTTRVARRRRSSGTKAYGESFVMKSDFAIARAHTVECARRRSRDAAPFEVLYV